MVLHSPNPDPLRSDPLSPEPRILERSEHPISRRFIDKNALKVLYRLHNAGLQGLPGRGERARPDDGPHAQGLRRGHQRPPQRGAAPVLELADHRPAVPAGARLLPRRRRRRGLDLPPRSRPGRAAGRAGRAADHQRQRLRHPPAGRLPPRLHHQRPVLQRRRLLGDRPRAGGSRTWSSSSCGRSATPTCASRKTPCACCAPASSPGGWASASRPAPRRRSTARRKELDEGLAGPRDRGDRPAPALRARRARPCSGCSSSASWKCCCPRPTPC